MNEIVNHVIDLSNGYPTERQLNIKAYLQEIIHEAVASPAYAASLLFDRNIHYDPKAQQSK